MEVSCQLLAPAALPPGKTPPSTNLMGWCVDLTAGRKFGEEKKLLSPSVQPIPGHRLNYGSLLKRTYINFIRSYRLLHNETFLLTYKYPQLHNWQRTREVVLDTCKWH